MANNHIKIGNGIGRITHHLSTPLFNLNLNDVFYVLHITKNLLSIHRFTKDTVTFFEFHPSFFLLKDRAIEKEVLLKGPSENGLYKIPASSSSANKSQLSKAFMGECHFVPQWHSCMGHPSVKVINKVLR